MFDIQEEFSVAVGRIDRFENVGDGFLSILDALFPDVLSVHL